MAGYKCTKCGETAHSKCAASRNMFPSNMYATLIGNILRISANRAGAKHDHYRNERCSDLWEVTYTFTMLQRAEDETQALAECEIADVLLNTSKDTLKIALCDHDWEMQSEECDLGCCHK